MPFGWELEFPKRNTGEYETTPTTISVTDRGSFRIEYRHEISIRTPDGSAYLELGKQEVNQLAYAFAQGYLNKDQLKKLYIRLEAMELGMSPGLLECL